MNEETRMPKVEVTMTTEVSPGVEITEEVEIFSYDEAILFMNAFYRRNLALPGIDDEEDENRDINIENLLKEIEQDIYLNGSAFYLSMYLSPENESSSFKGIPMSERQNPAVRDLMKTRMFSIKYRGKSKAGYHRPQSYIHKDFADTFAIYPYSNYGKSNFG